MSTRKARIFGSISALATALAACSSTPVGTSAPTASALLPSATATVAPTTSPTLAAAQAIPDGTYAGATMQVADIIALINADTKLSAAQKTDLIENAFEIKGHRTFVVSLEFQAGQLTERQSVDGAAQVGARYTYAFPDDHTLVIQEQHFGTTTFQVSQVQRGFTLKRLNVTPKEDEEETIAGKILFESSPFTLAP